MRFGSADSKGFAVGFYGSADCKGVRSEAGGIVAWRDLIFGLVGALTTARNQSGDIKLLKPSAHVLDLLKTTKLDGVFAIHQDESTAIQSFTRSAEATA